MWRVALARQRLPLTSYACESRTLAVEVEPIVQIHPPAKPSRSWFAFLNFLRSAAVRRRRHHSLKWDI